MFVLALICSTAAGCAGLMYPTVDLEDLPESQYEVTRYTSSTRSLSIILDDPNDDVLMCFGADGSRTKTMGLNPPQKYLKRFMGKPKAYEIQDKETEQVFGYLLISMDLEWLVHYNRGMKKVTISIKDPHGIGGNGGD
jgi:hypothetical protein